MAKYGNKATPIKGTRSQNYLLSDKNEIQQPSSHYNFFFIFVVTDDEIVFHNVDAQVRTIFIKFKMYLFLINKIHEYESYSTFFTTKFL